MTKYYQDKYKFNKESDLPVSVKNYEHDSSNETYYCNYCQRNLIKLIDSSHQNPSYYCQNCSINVDPSITDLRSKSKISMSEGPVERPSVAYPPEPSIVRKKKEIKGGLAEIAKKGSIRVTSYTESKV